MDRVQVRGNGPEGSWKVLRGLVGLLSLLGGGLLVGGCAAKADYLPEVALRAWSGGESSAESGSGGAAVARGAGKLGAGVQEGDELGLSEEARGAGQDQIQRFASHVTSHEPVYSVVGDRVRTNAKFQFSFKYRFAGELLKEDKLSGWARFLSGWYFGYSQRSIWDLESESAPFFDSTYMPTIFYGQPGVAGAEDGSWRLDLEAGAEHLSNGRGEPLSRSFNIAFVRPRLVLPLDEGLHFELRPKLYGFFGDLSDNPDIDEFRGYGDYEIALVEEDGWKLGLLYRQGRGSGRRTWQVDLTFPLDKLTGGSFASYFHVQYFHGYEDSLLTYDQRTPSQLRAGLSLIR